MFDGTRVKIGPGTLYWAPLASSEPVSVTAAWPSAWNPLGYTDAGSQFAYQPTASPVEVEEEYYPIKNVISGIAASITFALAEQTAQNLQLVLNDGAGAAAVSGTTGLNADGSFWVEPVTVGNEVRIMLGWDALGKGALVGDPFGRLIMRQCLQTGQVQIQRRKGNNKAIYSATYSLEKPTSSQPFRAIFPPSLQY